jgi:hypothetical protein
MWLQLCRAVSNAAGIADAEVACRFTRSQASSSIDDEPTQSDNPALFRQPVQLQHDRGVICHLVVCQCLTENARQIR